MPLLTGSEAMQAQELMLGPGFLRVHSQGKEDRSTRWRRPAEIGQLTPQRHCRTRAYRKSALECAAALFIIVRYRG